MEDNNTPTFADSFVTFGLHMKANPDLVLPYGVNWRFYSERHGYRDGLEIVLHSGTPIVLLTAWAQTLGDVSSSVRRYKDGKLHASVYGRIGDVAVLVCASVPGDGFPDEVGEHEWDVTALLQEA